MFTRSDVIVLTKRHKDTNKQTNKRRWKHPTLFATLYDAGLQELRYRWVSARCGCKAHSL